MTDKTRRRKRDEAVEATLQRDQAALPEAESLLTPTDAATANEEAEATAETAPISAPVQRARRAGGRKTARKKAAQAEAAVLEEEIAAAAQAASLRQLESQGFSEDEARKLIDISKRLEFSSEARETRRLRFTRWLVERGVLNEFSA